MQPSLNTVVIAFWLDKSLDLIGCRPLGYGKRNIFSFIRSTEFCSSYSADVALHMNRCLISLTHDFKLWIRCSHCVLTIKRMFHYPGDIDSNAQRAAVQVMIVVHLSALRSVSSTDCLICQHARDMHTMHNYKMIYVRSRYPIEVPSLWHWIGDETACKPSCCWRFV